VLAEVAVRVVLMETGGGQRVFMVIGVVLGLLGPAALGILAGRLSTGYAITAFLLYVAVVGIRPGGPAGLRRRRR
jgi:hypothetical protein